jgi:hypothetical protein
MGLAAARYVRLRKHCVDTRMRGAIGNDIVIIISKIVGLTQ